MIHVFAVRNYACLIKRNIIHQELQLQFTMPSAFSCCFSVSLLCVFSLHVKEHPLITDWTAACTWILEHLYWELWYYHSKLKNNKKLNVGVLVNYQWHCMLNVSNDLCWLLVAFPHLFAICHKTGLLQLYKPQWATKDLVHAWTVTLSRFCINLLDMLGFHLRLQCLYF